MPNLYIVPTPVGNLKDITLRAIEVLQSVDLILSEDTRVSGKLLKHLNISVPQQSFHMHNEHKKLDSVIKQLKQGKTLALISDAGTPGISDPGFLLIRACIELGFEVTTLPGATAFVPALVNSGLPCERFIFEGFLPIKKGRKTRLEQLSTENRTMIFYESPHKLLKTLNDFKIYFGVDRLTSISREISKLYEENQRGTVEQLIEYFTLNKPKGEFVLVVNGCQNK